MIIVSRIIHVKVDRRLNVTNKFKYQRRLSSHLAIVMFRGTPCIKLLVLVGFDLHFPLISGIYKLNLMKALLHTFQLSPCFISYKDMKKKSEFILSNIKNSFTLRGKRCNFLNL